MLIVHAGFMITGFIIVTTGALIAKFMRGGKWWLKAHRRLGMSGAVCVFAGFVMAYIMVSLYDGDHFGVRHAYMGLLSMLFAFLTPILGALQFRLREYASVIRIMHRWSGRTTILAMLLTIISGLFHANIISF
jgi:hypothetical protein